jgi:plastocyanin
MRTWRMWLVALLTGLVVIVGMPPSGEAARRNVAIAAKQFEPRELTVAVGDEVTWVNKDDGQAHSVTADDGSFDSSPDCAAANPGACMDKRAQFSHVFSAEGRFPYYSRPHGGPGGQGTSGVVVVVAPGTAPKPAPKP